MDPAGPGGWGIRGRQLLEGDREKGKVQLGILSSLLMEGLMNVSAFLLCFLSSSFNVCG